MALIPVKDYNPLKFIPFQYVTVAFIISCVGMFLWQVSLGEAVRETVYGLGTIPSVLLGTRELPPALAVVPAPATLVTSMFLHGGWMHLIGNMVFLWVFGDNVEDAMGHVRFVVFYLLCGVAAAMAHVFLNPGSTVPTIGASGAISGVLGAYLLLHPKARVLVVVPLGYFWHSMRLPAFVVLGIWIGLQFVNVLLEGGAGAEGGGVAWWAHIGGFVAGIGLIVPMRRRGVPLLDGLGRFAGAGPPHPAASTWPKRRGPVPDSGRHRRR